MSTKPGELHPPQPGDASDLTIGLMDVAAGELADAEEQRDTITETARSLRPVMSTRRPRQCPGSTMPCERRVARAAQLHVFRGALPPPR